MRIAVTGADGFIGRRLCSVAGANSTVDAIGRAGPSLFDVEAWSKRLVDVEVLVHLAARAHRFEQSDALREEYRRVNVQGSCCVAAAAANAGVRRIVFVSTIGVLGSASEGAPFTESAKPAPEDAYADSKLQAEVALRRITAGTGLELVIVRPPLVYGPHVKGNFLRLLRLMANRIPLPLGSIRNSRSFLGVDNLIDFLLLCADKKCAAGEVFLISDDEVISTPDLIRTLGGVIARPKLTPCPKWALRTMMQLAGRSAEYRRLSSNLVVDASHARKTLGWRPRNSMQEGLRAMANWYFRGAPA